MKVSGIVLFTLILSGFVGPRCGATVFHSNGSPANVQACINGAQNGDTITLPAGTFTWSRPVTVTKGVTIRGQTTVNSDTGVCDDRTILQDNFPAGYPGGQGFFHCTVNTGQFLRITGITFTNAPGNTVQQYGGTIRLYGNSTTVRLDHLHLTNLLQAQGITVSGSIYGVADHIVEDKLPPQRCQNRADNGGLYGDPAWAQPAGYGGPNFFFFEDWYINNTINGVNSASGGWDSFEGGKYVVRHCHLYDVQILGHGTETGRYRGGRAQELYNNDYHWSSPANLYGIRSGTMIAHDNTFDGGRPSGYGLQTYRTFHSFDGVWKGADGRNKWDYNVTESDGVTHIDRHSSYLFNKGTISAASGNDPARVTDRSKNWARNRWIGYELRRPSDGATAYISGNTNNTLTVRQWSPGPANWAAGNAYEIRRVLQAIDQPGLGAGDLLSGANPTPRWLHQVREGCWSWNNIYTPDSSHINFVLGRNAGAGGNLVEGLDYHNDTPLPGYTPYTYPHPLVTDAVRAAVADFNADGSPDFVLQNARTHQTAIWYLNNNVLFGSAFGPTLPNNWALRVVTDFNRDSHSDYALLNPITDQTVIWYLSAPTLIGGAYGPTVPGDWELVATGDFNNDGYPDYVLYNATTRQTAIWYLTNNVLVGGGHGPSLPVGWNLVGVADFNSDGHPDYALFNSSNGRTAIWYLSGPTLIGGAWGPTVPSNWILVATADFNRDGDPDYALYNARTRQTAIWYLNNNVWIGSASAPTIPAGWSFIAP
jgi:hypothetical protein